MLLKSFRTILAYLCLSVIVGGFISVPALGQAFGLSLPQSVLAAIATVSPVLIGIHYIDRWLDKINQS